MNKFSKRSAALTDLFTYIAKSIFSVVLGRKQLVSSKLQHSDYLNCSKNYQQNLLSL